jgi:restriction system protein
MTTRPYPTRADPPAPGLFAGLRPGAKAQYVEAVNAAEAGFQAAVAQWERWKTKRDDALARLKAEAEAHNRRVEDLKSALEAGAPDAERKYAAMVLLNSPYPRGFHGDLKIEFSPGSRELIVDLRAPTRADIIPTIELYQYAKARDQIIAVKRSEDNRQALYDLVVAQMALRTIHELFITDIGLHIGKIRLNLYSLVTDPGTGKTVRVLVLSTRVSREQFDDIELERVEPIACLRRLGSPGDFPIASPI